ncbi:hypothetical protein ZIOFF_053132 [Zingiber officinale]|uniref:Reverse transcriptase/retrotransposon-derived protein RNase H-like domain-containing protein n=1 Tax=Zingiber officinale TaxID=94328 RepID=A0A8J5KLQ4_ZINOF|nr:hypothetical protein ZIOFF_053132 [Zingiber officinale]
MASDSLALSGLQIWTPGLLSNLRQWFLEATTGRKCPKDNLNDEKPKPETTHSPEAPIRSTVLSSIKKPIGTKKTGGKTGGLGVKNLTTKRARAHTHTWRQRFKSSDWAIIREVKTLVQTLPDLELPSEKAYIIIETDGSMEGWGGVCKWKPSKYDSRKAEKICAYASGHTRETRSSTKKSISEKCEVPCRSKGEGTYKDLNIDFANFVKNPETKSSGNFTSSAGIFEGAKEVTTDPFTNTRRIDP